MTHLQNILREPLLILPASPAVKGREKMYQKRS
jgi:hypothetical protein